MMCILLPFDMICILHPLQDSGCNKFIRPFYPHECWAAWKGGTANSCAGWVAAVCTRYAASLRHVALARASVALL